MAIFKALFKSESTLHTHPLAWCPKGWALPPPVEPARRAPVEGLRR